MNEAQFVNISAAEVFQGNPYLANPHLTMIEPYKSIYNRDKSKDKKRASNEFYAIWVLVSPDESENKWMKISPERVKEIIAEVIKIDWNDELIIEAIKDYPTKCFTIAEKTLKGIHDKLLERDKFLKDSPYTMDYYMKDSKGGYVSKGNSFVLSSLPPKEIDIMIKNSVPLYKELAEAQKLFSITKDEMKIRGSRKATDLEDGTLFADYVR